MHRFALAAALGALGISASVTALARPRGEVMLAAALRERIPGKPVDCITIRLIRSVQVIDRIGILYETLDGTRYLNRPDSGASRLDSADVVVADTHTPELCDIDSVKMKDSLDGHLRGVVALGKFVPYRKDAAAH